MAASSSSLTAPSAPHFCSPIWRAGSSVRLPSLGEKRKSRASSKRYIQMINQKTVLTINKPSFQFRCQALSTTMMEAPALADESLLTGEDAVINAAAAEAVALARAAVEMAREAVLCFNTDPKSASETVLDPFYSELISPSSASDSVLNNSLSSFNVTTHASESESVWDPSELESVLKSFPSLNHSSFASESMPNPLSSLNQSNTASESVLNPSALVLEAVLNRFPSLRGSSLASESALNNPIPSTLASESVLNKPIPSTLAVPESVLNNPIPLGLASESVPKANPSSPSSRPSESISNPNSSALASASMQNNPISSTLASESVLTEPPTSPFEDLIGIHELPLGADVEVRVGSTRQGERRERRQRAAEKAAARAVPVKKRRTKKDGGRDFKDPVKLFKRMASSYKTLTAQQERELSLGVQDLLKLEAIQKQLTERNGEEPSFEMWAAACQLDQRTLNRRLDNGALCKQTMVRSNIRLVISIAKHFIGAGLPFEDIVQEGCRGLVRGVEKFDGTKGFKFSTYAHWWIKQAIRRALSERSRLIQLPFNMVNASYRVKDAVKQLKGSGKTGRLSNDDIARVAGISKKTVQSVLTLPKNPISFDAMIGFDFNIKLSDTIACKEEDSPEYMFNKELTKSGLDMVLDTLNPREKQVVRWRYGLEDGRAKTLQEIGDTLSISRERVRQIESSAFRKLKSKKRVEMLQKYVDM